MNVTNSSRIKSLAPTSSSTETIITVVFMISVSTIATIGNALIIAAVIWNHRLRTATNLLFLNLAVADFFQGSVAMPLRLAEVLNNTDKQPLVPCLVVIPLTVFFFGSSNFNVTLISLDRFVALHWSFIYPVLATPGNLFLIIFTVWAFMLILALFPVFGVGRAINVETTNICLYTTTFTEEYLYFLFSIVNFGVIIVIAVTNIYILKTARRQIRCIHVLEQTTKNDLNTAGQSRRGSRPETSHNFEPDEIALKSNFGDNLAVAVGNKAVFVGGNHLKNDNRVSVIKSEIVKYSTENIENSKRISEIYTKAQPSGKQELSITNLVDDKLANSCLSSLEISADNSTKRKYTKKQTLYKERRATKTVLVIVGLFIVLTTPITVIDIVTLCGCIACTPPTVIKIFVCLAYSNACVNVFVYAGYKKDMTNTWVAMVKRIKAALCKRAGVVGK